MVTIFKDFLPISAQKCADFSIGLTRYDVLDNFSFDFSLKNGGVIAVFSENNVYDITRPEVCRSNAEVAPCCSHTVVHYFILT